MRQLLASAAIISFVLVGAAVAEPGKGKGHDKHGGGKVSRSVDRNADHPRGHVTRRGERGHQAVANGAWTPPGLAKKPHGMPPGQAKKMWSQGDRLPNQYYSEQRYFVNDPSRYNLPPAPYGSRWVQIGDTYYQTRTDTGIVSSVISALLR